jgi:hypothetical protein
MAKTIKTTIMRLPDVVDIAGEAELDAQATLIKQEIKNKYDNGWELLSTSGFSQTKSGKVLLLLVYHKEE